MDLSFALDAFASSYTVTRAGALEFDSDTGRPTQAAPSTFAISAVVMPPSGIDLQRLPEGLRAEQTNVLFTVTPLVLLPVPDQISIGGVIWQVEDVDAWDALGGFFRVLVRKVGA